MAKLGSLTWTCPSCGEGCTVELNVRPGPSAFEVTGRRTLRIYPDMSAVVTHFTLCQGLQERIAAGESQDVLLMDGAGEMFNVGTVSASEPEPEPEPEFYDQGGDLPSGVTLSTNDTDEPKLVVPIAEAAEPQSQ